MAQKIGQLLSGCDYDLVIASQLSMAAYHPYFRETPALFEEFEIGLSFSAANRSSAFKKRLRHAITWLKLRMYLSRLLASFQACTVVSEPERRLLDHNFSMYKGRVEVIPNCVRLDEYENQHVAVVPNQLIFAGSFRYDANYEAMRWFLCEVFPRVLERVPDASLLITGDHANRPLPAISNVTLTGHVDDLKTLVASSCVSVAPLLSGGGTRLKILESMAIGTPVISTLKGAEGLDALNGEHLFLADASLDFADCVVNVLKNKDLHDQLSVRGKQFVKQNYNWETVMPRFLRLVENITG
jgi:glycosyltransferase involved in cell wall biosynthesis